MNVTHTARRTMDTTALPGKLILNGSIERPFNATSPVATDSDVVRMCSELTSPAEWALVIYRVRRLAVTSGCTLGRALWLVTAAGKYIPCTTEPNGGE